MATAKGTFEVKDWNEDTYEELEGGGKLTLATVAYRLTGDIDGSGTVRWLMAYRADGTAHYTGIQLVTGSLAGHDGSFVLATDGDFDGKVAKGTWEVVAGAGSGALAGLSGGGTATAPYGATATYELGYDLGQR